MAADTLPRWSFGLGACFFGLPADRVDTFRTEFGIPPEYSPIGAISIGYRNEPPRDLSARRRPKTEVVHEAAGNSRRGSGLALYRVHGLLEEAITRFAITQYKYYVLGINMLPGFHAPLGS